AEFVIGHGATPYRNGRVLHSVFAAAMLHAGFISFRASSTHEVADGNNEKDRIYPVADPPGYAVMLGFLLRASIDESAASSKGDIDHTAVFRVAKLKT
ncbi:hypothetical protein N0713_28925, partial [Pseudomonas aeruginosa]|nr:hypothetical protein [Pseudomonas aeruginosa]